MSAGLSEKRPTSARRSRGASWIATLAVIGLGATACSSSPATNPGDGQGGTGSGGAVASGPVGYSEAKLTDSFQVLLAKGLEARAKAAAVNLLPAVDANADPAKQNADVTTLLERGVKALLIVPVDSTAIVPVVKKANDARIPVVTVDVPANGGSVYMTVHADNVFMGKEACESLGKAMGGKGTALNLQGDLASANGLDRSNGFTDCMKSKFPGISVISKPMYWKPETCAQQAQTVLSTTNISGIYMGSEIICLAAVTKVLKGLHKLAPVGQPGHIPLVGIDGSSNGLNAIRNGTMDALVSQPLNDYVKYALLYLHDALTGVKVKLGPTDHNSKIIKVGNSYEDVLPSPVVTKANVNDKSLWGNG